MKVGDLVAAKLYTDDVMLGIVSHVAQLAPVADVDGYVDSMYPYFVCFNDNSFNDWYAASTLEVVSENR